jgi:hypothetical protein
MAKVLAGRLVLSFAAIFTAVTPYLADWNETHIFNPRWTPHAKFHNAQTMAFAALLGLLALGYTWRRRAHGNDRERLVTAGLFAGLYWATQGIAHFYPGVAYRDPEFVTSADLHPFLGMTPQGMIDIVALAVTALGVWLAGGSSHKPAN